MLSTYYNAARNQAAVVEKDWMGALVLTGAERVSWLQGMISNDVQQLAPGQGCYAAHLNAQGKIVAPMTVLVDADAIWLSVERACVDLLAAAFDRLIIMEDVQVQNVSDEYQALGVIGPDADRILESWVGEPLQISQIDQHRRIGDQRVVRGELGYDVWIRREVSDKALRAIAGSGATPIDRGTWDVLRAEAGLPLYGVDIDETTTLPELGEHGISYDKGCYIGQEVVAKVKYIGHVNRKFMGFVCSGDQPAEAGSKVRSSGKDAGYVTTALISPGLGKPIALGFVNRAAATPGTAVVLEGPERSVDAVVTSLPFVSQ
jgi:folate-binding protein YgfZ